MMAAPAHSGPSVHDETITFRLHDPDQAFEAVGLMQDLRRPRDWTPLKKSEPDAMWTVDVPRLAVDRMEYQFKGVHRDGGDEIFCDPTNPLRAPGAFGDKSVVLLPSYESPRWFDEFEPPGGELLSTTVPSRALRTDLHLRLWSSRDAGVEDELPLLVAHDGPEYADYAGLLRFLDVLTTSGALPPMRAVLLEPPWPRDEHYSASATYARALAMDLLPALQWLAPVPGNDRRYRVAMGASLGALAMLHAHRLRPHAFGGLYLQSGSFFRRRFDRQESGFPRFRRISRFVGEVLNAGAFAGPVPTVLTCGTVEENLANNRAVTEALERQGYPVRLIANRDAHNYVAWRDTFDPHLAQLLSALWPGFTNHGMTRRA
jgi:enterochelin esterase family protein